MTAANRKRLAFCAYDRSTRPLGGPIVWTERLLPSLQQQNIDITALLYTAGNPDEGRLVRSFSQDEIRWFVSSFGERPFLEQQVTWTVSMLRRVQPDVVVVNLVTEGLFAIRAIREAGIPTVGVLHSHTDPFYQEMIDAFIGGPPAFAMDTAVCVSERLRQEVQSLLPAHTTCRTISCGAPVPERPIAPPGETLWILYAGRLVQKQKRIRELTHAFIRTCREIPEVAASICGGGPEEDAVRQTIASAAMESHVTLTGDIEPDRMPDIMSQHHVIVLLSDYEGLPMALIEGMAHGLVPICLHEESGVAEVVKDGINGLIVKDRGDDFVRAVRQLAFDQALWMRLSAAARQTVIERYSATVEDAKWVELIRDLAHRNASTRLPRKPHRGYYRGMNGVMRTYCRRRPPLLARLSETYRTRGTSVRLFLRPRARLRAWLHGKMKPTTTHSEGSDPSNKKPPN